MLISCVCRQKPPHAISHVVFSIIIDNIRRPATNRLLSSAYNFVGMLWTQFATQLTHTRNSCGPMTLPCVTPQLILSILESKSWCHCHSLSLAPVKSRLVLPFWYRLTWVVPDKGPLNGCVCVWYWNLRH